MILLEVQSCILYEIVNNLRFESACEPTLTLVRGHEVLRLDFGRIVLGIAHGFLRVLQSSSKYTRIVDPLYFHDLHGHTIIK